jgi:putative transposase
MTFRPELLDELLKNYTNPEDLLGEGGILKQLTKALVERCLNAEMDEHLETERSQPSEDKPKNRRNGHSKKTIKGEFGEAEIVTPRDRNGEFEPILVRKGQTRFDGFSYTVPYGGKPSSRTVRLMTRFCRCTHAA